MEFLLGGWCSLVIQSSVLEITYQSPVSHLFPTRRCVRAFGLQLSKCVYTSKWITVFFSVTDGYLREIIHIQSFRKKSFNNHQMISVKFPTFLVYLQSVRKRVTENNIPFIYSKIILIYEKIFVSVFSFIEVIVTYPIKYFHIFMTGGTEIIYSFTVSLLKPKIIFKILVGFASSY